MKNSGTVRMEQSGWCCAHLCDRRDADAMFRNWANDPQVTKCTSPGNLTRDVEETKQILEGWIKSYESKDFYTWAIARKETREMSSGLFLFQT